MGLGGYSGGGIGSAAAAGLLLHHAFANLVDAATDRQTLGGASSLTYANGTVIDLGIAQIVYDDPQGLFDIANDRVEIKQAGRYEITAVIGVDDDGGAGTRYRLFIGDTSSALAASSINVAAAEQFIGPVVFDKDFEAGDYVDFRVGSDSAETGGLRALQIAIKQLPQVSLA